jgi:tetratricopeptide (TPR) repeat protein
MSRKSALEMSASALAQADMGAAPVHASVIGAAIGDSASNESIERLKRATQQIKNAENAKLLGRAVQAVHEHDYVKADKLAMKLLKKDEQMGLAWHIVGIAREKQGDFASSLRAYEAALRLISDHGSVAGDLGRLAFRLSMPELAAKFFAHYRLARPKEIEAANNLACALRELNREDEAIEVLKAAIGENPTAAALWNTLGTVICNTGNAEGSIVFFDEALRLAPEAGKIYHNRAFAKMDMGDLKGSLIDCDDAMSRQNSAEDAATMAFARSTVLLGLGRLVEGWKAYEARFSDEVRQAPRFHIPGTRWSGQDLKGKTLMVSTEQGLGDEIMFANMLPDILEALGPDGSLTLAVEQRLVPLFERSYPGVEITAHRTVTYEGRVIRMAPYVQDWDRFDYWAAIGDFLSSQRPSADAFPNRAAFLTPDPERVAHWKTELEKLGPGPKVGLLWKSLNLTSERARQFSPFDAWRPILETPGITFVNLQYGDCSDEIAVAKAEFGVEVWQPPGIDLKQDLDDVTALCRAVDLVVGFSNATTNLAGAVGTPLWMITNVAAWTRLGSDHYPWYPQARCFTTDSYNHWDKPMAKIADALKVLAKET